MWLGTVNEVAIFNPQSQPHTNLTFSQKPNRPGCFGCFLPSDGNTPKKCFVYNYSDAIFCV